MYQIFFPQSPRGVLDRLFFARLYFSLAKIGAEWRAELHQVRDVLSNSPANSGRVHAHPIHREAAPRTAKPLRPEAIARARLLRLVEAHLLVAQRAHCPRLQHRNRQARHVAAGGQGHLPSADGQGCQGVGASGRRVHGDEARPLEAVFGCSGCQVSRGAGGVQKGLQVRV